jgi:hypothetical protein
MNFCVSLLDALKVRRIILAKVVSMEGSSFHFNKTILLSVPANKIAPGRLGMVLVMAASSTVVSPEIIFRLMESFRRFHLNDGAYGNFVNGNVLFSNLTKAVFGALFTN